MIGQAFVLALAFAASLVPNTTASVRRLHDRDKSGWWVLAPLILTLLLVGVLFILLYIFLLLFFIANFRTCSSRFRGWRILSPFQS
jgi:uncharacterized membrane protein YhaH (DUF805 family)